MCHPMCLSDFFSAKAGQHVVEVECHEDVVGDPQGLDRPLPAEDQVVRCHEHHQSKKVPENLQVFYAFENRSWSAVTPA